jgi:hypothetical protein
MQTGARLVSFVAWGSSMAGISPTQERLFRQTARLSLIVVVCQMSISCLSFREPSTASRNQALNKGVEIEAIAQSLKVLCFPGEVSREDGRLRLTLHMYLYNLANVPVAVNMEPGAEWSWHNTPGFGGMGYSAMDRFVVLRPAKDVPKKMRHPGEQIFMASGEDEDDAPGEGYFRLPIRVGEGQVPWRKSEGILDLSLVFDVLRDNGIHHLKFSGKLPARDLLSDAVIPAPGD